MDFLALPRRDLQALCKRNGIRANMTSAAMADALRALPKVEGIEEYVKVLQPVAVPQTAVDSVNEEQKLKKTERPLPRGRRAMAKSSEPIEPEEDKEKLEEDAKRQSNKEGAEAPGVGRHGASRRARPVHTVPLPMGKAVAEEDGQEDNLKQEAKRDTAPAPVVGRRGASRRARPSPAVAAPAAESEVAGAEEEQMVENVEDHKQEATMDDVPALGVSRCGASRRARPAPSVAALAGKVVAEEEQRGPIPRGRHVKAKGSSTEPIRLDDSDDEGKEDSEPEEQEQEDAQILGVGRRGGASRRPQAAPTVAAPEAKAEEEQRAPVPHGRRVKAKSTELDIKDHTKPEEERGDAPAIGVRRRGASQRAPAPSEASATRRRAEAGDVAVEDVPIRAARQRKPTMKAAAAAAVAQEKAPRRASRRGAVISTLLHKEVPEKPQEAVGAPDVAVEAVPIQATRQRKPTMKAVAAAATAEEKVPPRATRRGALMRTLLPQEVQEEPQEAVGAPVSYQRCDALEELEEASDPQKEELNEVDAPKQDEDQNLVIAEDEKLMEETPGEQPSMTVQECVDNSEMQEQLVDDEKCHAPLATQEDEDKDVVVIEDEKLMEETPAEEPSVTDQECMDNSEMQEQQVDDEKYHASLTTQEESPILGFVSTVTEHASEDDEGASFQDDGGSSSALLLDKGVCEDETYDAGEEVELVPSVQTLQAPLTGNKSDANHESEIGFVRKEITEVDTKDDEFCKEKEHIDIAELQADVVDEATFLDCSGNISQVAGEDTNEEVNTEDGRSFQEEGDVVVDKVLHDSMDNTILLDCSSDISWVEVEKAGNITNEMLENQAALDEDGDKPNGAVIGDSMSQATVTDEVVQEEKGVLVTDEILQGTAGMHDMEGDRFETVFVQADQVATADHLPEQVTDCEITVEVNTSLIVDERQQSTVTLDEDVAEDHSETLDVLSNEQIEVVTTDKVPELKLIEDVLVQADQVVAADNLPEQVTDCEITVEENTTLTVTMAEDADEQMEVEVPELTGTNVEVIEEKTPPAVDEKQKSIVTMDTDVVDGHFKSDVRADEQMEIELAETDVEVVEEIETPLVVDEKNQITIKNNGGIVDDHFKTHGAHADEQKEVVATEVPEVTGTDGEIGEKTSLIVDEKNQSTITMEGDVVFDHLKADTADAYEQKEDIGIVTEVSDEITGTDDEIIEEKAVVVTEDMPMDGCLKENHFGTGFGHGNEQKKAITADIEPEDGSARKEIALLDDVTESLSKRTITMEPSVCKNSSEKNPAEPMVVLEEKGVKVASESEDLIKLSLGQLRAKLKEKLNAKKNKEAKRRVALARVDENVCRSHTKEQQQNLNLQQH